jgi:hypothetical protein
LEVTLEAGILYPPRELTDVIGRIRLENPDRGFALVSWNGPLLAVSADGGDSWEISAFLEGLEYFGHAPLSRSEVRALASGVVGPEPDRWRWTAMPAEGSPRYLPRPARPKRARLALLASEAVSTFPTDSETLPFLDRVEVWLCEPSTDRPLARVGTALTAERALAQTHVGPFQVVEPWRHTPETWTFQQRLNARLNNADSPGRYRFVVRLFERTDSGAVRVGQSGFGGPVAPGLLPEGPLAEPWESSRRALLDRLSVRDPGRVPPHSARRSSKTDKHLGTVAGISWAAG